VSRFRDHTCRIWTKHDIAQIGFWTVTIGESNNDFIYLLSFDSMADRESKWDAFISDPEWVVALTTSEENGPLIQTLSSQFLKPTSMTDMTSLRHDGDTRFERGDHPAHAHRLGPEIAAATEGPDQRLIPLRKSGRYCDEYHMDSLTPVSESPLGRR